MKLAAYLPIFLFVFCTTSFGQVNGNNAFQKVLTRNQIGKEFAFNKSKAGYYDSLVLVYLGNIKTKKGRVVKVITSRWYWGSGPRATSRIIIFNSKNQYLGDYYVTMTDDVPDRIEGTSLVFVNAKRGNCVPGLVTKVNFRNGIPREFFLKCDERYGDVYSFQQNL